MLRPVEIRSSAHGARACWRTWRCCLRVQRGARSTPRRWPRLFFIDTATGRRLRLRNAVTIAFESRGARRARASPRVEPADRPRSTRALADLAWSSLRPTRGALHPTPLAEALLHRHRDRSAAAASKRAVTTAFKSRGAQRARASPRGEPADRQRSTRALADLAWFSSRPTWPRSTLRRWTRLFFNNTAPGRRLRLQTIATVALDSRGAWPARAWPRGGIDPS